jgi:hypothetical protein
LVRRRWGLLVFVDNDVDIATDDGWTRRVITGVTSVACSAGGAGFELGFATAISAAPDSLTMITIGSPVRTYEDMEIGALVQGGETWLAARSISAGQTFQPVLGPLATSGVRFEYLTAGGGAGATAMTARSVRLTLFGITDNVVIAGAGTNAGARAVDSLTTTVKLRNTP